MNTPPRNGHDDRRRAMRFIVLLGAVSLFADLTYESARSIIGPFLGVLGASATVVGVVAGLGELVGYGLRIVFGILSDRTHRYWSITIVGYAINLLAVPALALAGRWEVAAALIVAERLGKAVRSPARDAMLSHATHTVGRGWGFGIHEAMDQIGAMGGPLIVAVVLARRGGYHNAFAVLAIPAVLALCVLVVARLVYPRPQEFEPPSPRIGAHGFQRAFWLYLAAVGLVAMGFADYSLAAFHMQRTMIVSDAWIPVLYSGAMGVDAITALVLGRLYDRVGVRAVMIAVFLSAWFAPLVFSTGLAGVIAGVALWGIGLGAQESIVRAVVSDLVPSERRGTGYGMFNTGFGVAWFAGSALMGFLYDHSRATLMVFSVVVQLASLPLFHRVGKALPARARRA